MKQPRNAWEVRYSHWPKSNTQATRPHPAEVVMAASEAAEGQAWAAKLSEYRTQYDRVRRLVDVESASDPPTEPYKSKYEARRILKELLEDLNRVEYDAPRKKDLIRAVAKYELGVIATDTEEVSLGKEYLESCLRAVGEHYKEPACCLIAVAALNQLGIVHVRRGDSSRALDYLKRAEGIYSKVSSSTEQNAKIADFKDHFVPDDPAKEVEASQDGTSKSQNFELAHTHTLYYLAQVYESLGENAKAAMYCHSTLKKELALEQFDSIDWAINAATLSQFFIARGDFNAGRHLLACSRHVLDRYAKKLDSEKLTPEEKEGKEESLKRRSADVARCWAKYGLFLLIASRERATDPAEGVARELNCLAVDKKPHTLIKSPEVDEIEQSITDKLVADFDGARPVFLKSQKWLEDAKQFYALRDHATDHVEIVQEMSKLYRELAHFEPAPDRKCKMHKRRIDMLEEVLKEVNPQFYLGICRQVMFELGEIYSEMMSLKLAALPPAVKPQSPAVKKVNSIIDKAIRHYQSFLETVKNSDGEYPERLPEDLARPVLVAQFYIGRLYSNIVAQEPREQFANFEKTKEHYEFVQNYCEKVPEHAPLMKDELEIMTQLLQLIPGTLQKMMSTTLY